MHTRDAQGRRVSLLNDDTSHTMVYHQDPYFQATYSEAPVLLRAESYDSQNSGDVLSPATPGVYDYGRPSMSGHSFVTDHLYDDHRAVDSQTTFSSGSSSRSKQSGLAGSSRSTSYDEDSSANSSSVQDRPGKRYPCRYRDTHGCDKTFTTSGHASRHSKIHTAEKAVPCSFPNCHKKFTRADNMKQHLETHYKEKSSRSSGSRSSAMTASSSSRRTSASSSHTGSSSHHHHHHHNHSHSHPHRTSREAADIVAWEAAQYDQRRSHSPNEYSIPSPVPGTAWDLRTLHADLGGIQRAPNSGLDALAMAVACQEAGYS